MARHRLGAMALTVVLAGCGTAETVRIPVNLSEAYGGPQTIYAHSRNVPEWVSWVFNPSEAAKLDFVVHGDVTEEDLDAVATVEEACRLYTDTVSPNKLVAVFLNGALYFGAGFVGGALGSMAFPGTDSGDYGQYTGTVTGFGGAANGIITLGGRTYTFENCGREILEGSSVRVLNRYPF